MKSDVGVYKFGGASVRDAEAVRNVASIVKAANGPLVIVVSAMDKMTNALEKLTNAYFEESDEVLAAYNEVKTFHWNLATELFEPGHDVFARMNDLFVEIDWIIEESPEDSYDYIYDQIVSIGEFLSTRIVSAFLDSEGVGNTWLDVRDVLKTDNAHREARVEWKLTSDLIPKLVRRHLEKTRVIVTQGFIGCTSENFTSTLGREGSDFSAAIFAHCLDAKSLTIWKDVEGVLTADPKAFDDVTKIDRLTYLEAIEMTYYGAKVLHPKTIKPLQNKSIPLYVRSFEHPEKNGTWIGTDLDGIIPPVVVLEENQCLIHISTRDFSFVAEHHLSQVFAHLASQRIKVNLMRNTAISFSVCCTFHQRKIEALSKLLEASFDVIVDTDLMLLTVRHANDAVLKSLLGDKTVIMEERFRETVQCVVRVAKAPRLRGIGL